MKKIMFNDKFELTRAVLEGRKTMTRRIITGNFEEMGAYNVNCEWIFYADTKDGDRVEVKPRYAIGEKVAIAQPYKDAIHPLDWVNKEIYRDTAAWNNKMFVLPDLMPHKIIITDIWYERLQDISEGDCMREGVEKWLACNIVPGIMERNKNNMCFDTPREAFAALIDKVCGKGTWESNPRVFVYTFKLVED